jgi:hypothetical protein
MKTVENNAVCYMKFEVKKTFDTVSYKSPHGFYPYKLVFGNSMNKCVLLFIVPCGRFCTPSFHLFSVVSPAGNS